MPLVTLENCVTVKLPPGFRLIRKEDIHKKFTSEDRTMRDYKLSYFYEWNMENNSTVIVRESQDRMIDGVIMFRFVPGINNPEKIVIEMLARNFSMGSGSSGVGADLLKVVENNIARPIHIRRIEIEAIKNLEDYYESLGYHPEGSEYFDSSWKRIVNMVKMIN